MGPGDGPRREGLSLAPLAGSCEPGSYDELDLLRGKAARHPPLGWLRRLTGDEAYFAACSCGWRSTETGPVSPLGR